MKNRTVRIIVDLLMVIILIHELIPTEIVPIRHHCIMGLVFILFIFVHIGLNRKWCVSVTKTLLAKKGTKHLKNRYFFNLILLVIWSLVGLTGLLAMRAESGEMIVALFVFKFIHVFLAIMGLFLIVAHLYQHKAQIKSYITQKRKFIIQTKQSHRF